MGLSSSRDLHPAHGGRFVLTRVSEDPLVYEVTIHLPQEQRLQTQLRWNDGIATLEPALDDAWAQDEALKLARVLRRGEQSSLTRWRGR